MGVEGPDRAGTARGRPKSGGRRPGGGPGPSAFNPIKHLPLAWPECAAFRNAVLLFTEAEDDVPGILRTGGNVLSYLDQAGVAAWTELGTASFERWFLLGWSRAAEAEEGG